MTRIVVGIDGSEESRLALRWALAEAELRDAELVLVHAWRHVPVAAYAGFAGTPAFTDTWEASREQAEELLHHVADEVAGDRPVRPLEFVAAEGSPAETLVEASKGADLLVVGSRGHGGFAGLLLGSVSQQCAHHAACPIVIVRSQHQS